MDIFKKYKKEIEEILDLLIELEDKFSEAQMYESIYEFERYTSALADDLLAILTPQFKKDIIKWKNKRRSNKDANI